MVSAHQHYCTLIILAISPKVNPTFEDFYGTFCGVPFAIDKNVHSCYNAISVSRVPSRKGLTNCPPTTEYGEPDRFRSIAEIVSGYFYAYAGAERMMLSPKQTIKSLIESCRAVAERDATARANREADRKYPDIKQGNSLPQNKQTRNF